MKRLFFAMMLLVVGMVSAHAENIYGYTTNCLVWNEYYSEWQAIDNGANIKVVITDKGFYINSASPQVFKWYNLSSAHYNQSGHLQHTASAIDQDNHRCNIRIVFRDDVGCEAPLQIYIYYNNISYVYNIVTTSGSYI